MTKILLAIVAQRATKYNKILRRMRRNKEEFSPALETAEGALDKALAAVQEIGYIGIIRLMDNTIDRIIIGDHLLEIK